MNILIINPILYTPKPNGASVHRITTIKHTMIYNYALGFVQLGHNVTIVASDEYRPTKSEQYEVEIVFMPNIAKKCIKRWPNGFPILNGLFSYIYRNRRTFDLIIVSEIFTQQALITSMLAPSKTIIWQEMYHHAPHLHRIPSILWHNVIVKYLFSNKIKVVTRSHIAKNFISKYCNHVSDIIIDHGVNINNFAIETLKNKQFVVVANFFDYKRIDEIIDIFAKFIRKYDNKYKLYLAGDGEMRDSLQKQVYDLKIQDNVIFCGFLSHAELSKIVSKSQAAFVRTVKDLNMVSIPEILACATPIITNMTPLRAKYISKSGMGIAKDNWTEDDIQVLVANNDKFVNNCVEHHYELSSEYRAKQMIKVLNDEI